MRYSARQKQETRERIVRAASRHFRGRGWDGVAIADLMSKLNLTHGGFYRHFDSKEELFAEAVAKGLEEVRAKLKCVADEQPGGELHAQQPFLVYLSQQLDETKSAGSLAFSTQSFPTRDRTMEAALSSPSAANAFPTATIPDRLCLFSAATIARRRSAFVEE
jgi:AcrR family transcriptional regulator